ncbi:MAG: hypothetical protein HYX67_17200 [Candidatus Melainabacteria bacterium]|nr:hypothetical protein [Candidatus Melainabacteria bacterium]
MATRTINTESRNFLEEVVKFQNFMKEEREETRYQKVIDYELKLDALARKTLNPDLTDAERRTAQNDLLLARSHLLSHVSVNGVKDSSLFINLQQPLIPAQQLCAAYNKMGVPTVSNYHFIGNNNIIFRLCPSAIKHIPKEILEKTGDLAGKEVDLFCTYISGKYVEMGIFPELGVERAHQPGAIAFHSLSPMQVHAHPTSKGVKTAQAMLYSPDNAHFRFTEGSPFSVFWAVTKKDQRIAITKMFVSLEEHPIAFPFSTGGTLAEFLERCSEMKQGIAHTFQPLIALYKTDPVAASKAFRNLPKSFQNGIFKEVYLDFNSPHGVHNDFGRASFLADNSLDRKFHCDNARRARVVERFVVSLNTLLVDSQFDLLQNSQPLIKEEGALKMMQCARLFFGKKDAEAKREFNIFSQEIKNAVEATCEHLNRSSLHRIENAFALAILIVASRANPASILPVLGSGKMEDLPAPLELKTPSCVEHLMTLLFNPDFSALSKETRAKDANKLLKQLPDPQRWSIYGKVYTGSTDSHKGGPDWGEEHVADDLNLLINAVQDTLS